MIGSFYFVVVQILLAEDVLSRCQGSANVSRKMNRREGSHVSRYLDSHDDQEVAFRGKLNSSCRSKSGGKGTVGKDFEVLTDVTLEECMMQCKGSLMCAGYEFIPKDSNSEEHEDQGDACHLWNHYGPGSKKKKGHYCFWKETACCQPPITSKCNKKLEPIKCGPADCEYQNYCLAENAGWEKKECTKRCLEPPEPDACNGEEFNPVRCGNGKDSCEYDNLCLAMQAGLSAEACSLTCDYEKSPGCIVACTSELRPVVCGQNKCTFDNPCLGTKAFGYNESQCDDVAVDAEEKSASP